MMIGRATMSGIFGFWFFRVSPGQNFSFVDEPSVFPDRIVTRGPPPEETVLKTFFPFLSPLTSPERHFVSKIVEFGPECVFPRARLRS